MQPATQELLHALGSTHWLERIGASASGPDIVNLRNWEEVGNYFADPFWRDVKNESRNLLSQNLHDLHSQRYQQWNAHTAELRPEVIALVGRQLSSVEWPTEVVPQKLMVDQANWICLIAAMEQEYSDLVPPRFATDWANWYVKGHFPCGWVGDFPKGGKLVVL